MTWRRRRSRSGRSSSPRAGPCRRRCARENNLAGQIREVVAKYHPDVRDAVRQAEQATKGRGLQFVDSAVGSGVVELPGRLRGSDRFIRLGTDRIAGAAKIAPQDIPIVWRDGSQGIIHVEGELEVSLAIEIKGRTTATGGIEQIRNLADRGGRGYAIIDGKLWLLKYDPAQTAHVVMAAPGVELRQAAALADRLTAQGVPTRVLEIPTLLDDEIKALARGLLGEAAATNIR